MAREGKLAAGGEVDTVIQGDEGAGLHGVPTVLRYLTSDLAASFQRFPAHTLCLGEQSTDHITTEGDGPADFCDKQAPVHNTSVAPPSCTSEES